MHKASGRGQQRERPPPPPRDAPVSQVTHLARRLVRPLPASAHIAAAVKGGWRAEAFVPAGPGVKDAETDAPVAWQQAHPLVLDKHQLCIPFRLRDPQLTLLRRLSATPEGRRVSVPTLGLLHKVGSRC